MKCKIKLVFLKVWSLDQPASAPPENLLEMQIPKTHPVMTEKS